MAATSVKLDLLRTSLADEVGNTRKLAGSLTGPATIMLGTSDLSPTMPKARAVLVGDMMSRTPAPALPTVV